MHSSVKREMPEGMEEHRDCECRVVGFCLVTINCGKEASLLQVEKDKGLRGGLLPRLFNKTVAARAPLAAGLYVGSRVQNSLLELADSHTLRLLQSLRLSVPTFLN